MTNKRNRDEATSNDVPPDSQRQRQEYDATGASSSSSKDVNASGKVADSDMQLGQLTAMEASDVQNIEDDASRHVPWWTLPGDPLSIIMDKVASDAIRLLSFGVTCGSLRNVVKESGRNDLIKPGTPTLITSFLGGGAWCSERSIEYGKFALHDLSKDEGPSQCQSDLLRNKTWLAGKDDWLVTCDANMRLTMVNLIQGYVIQLPQISDVEEISTFEKSLGAWMPRLRVNHVVLARTPIHNSGYFVVVMLSFDKILFTKLGDVSWSILKGADVSWSGFCHVIVHDNNLVAVSEDGDLFAWDITGDLSLPSRLKGPNLNADPKKWNEKRCCFLGLSVEGAILLMCIKGSPIFKGCFRGLARNKLTDFYPHFVEVYKLDTVLGSWTVVEDFGGSRSLFLGGGYHFFFSVTDPSHRIKPNCVHLSDVIGYDYTILHLGKEGRDAVEKIQLEVVGDPLHRPMWFRPTTCSR